MHGKYNFKFTIIYFHLTWCLADMMEQTGQLTSDAVVYTFSVVTINYVKSAACGNTLVACS
jgi:hypothetical protein